jgi:hypothetical protein
MESSFKNGWVQGVRKERSRSPNFGATRNASTSASRKRPVSVQYSYVKEDGDSVSLDRTATLSKPNNIGITHLK